MLLSISTFWSNFLFFVMWYYPESSDPRCKPPDTVQSELYEPFDFIIVGAGSAGCVVASRLSENPEWKVLLIEAGGDEDPISDTPYFAPYLRGTDKDWNYTTIRQNYACLSTDGYCSFPRGRVMGGSSTLNYMVYARGAKEDYDGWAKMGNPGWGFEDVLPYFIRAENYKIPSLRSSPIHGTDGPLSVQYARYRSALREEYIKATQEIGFHLGDYNGGNPRNVVDYLHYTINGPSRHSTSSAYLNPVRHRRNLKVIKRSLVKKIIIDNKVAQGVEYIRNGRSYKAFGKEVIVSAGAIDSPKLLLLSGIGPKEELEGHGINVVEDLPVGKELKDHLFVSTFFEVENVKTITPEVWRTDESIIKYARDKQGPLTAYSCEVSAYFNPLDAEGPPSVQLLYAHGYADLLGCSNKTILWLIAGLVAPKSVGSLKLRSGDYRDPPLIDPNYLSETDDVLVLSKGIDALFEFIRSPTMRKYSPKLFTDNQPYCRGLTEQDYKKCVLSYYSSSYYHPVATARMGPSADKYSVVSSRDLKVRGIKYLRVIDASVMPKLPRANTNAAAIMVGEKGSEIIKQEHTHTLT